ncbi:hypothetical protein GCM10025867_47870 (plasmid) [Frondihabitans sucicola]|uniref:Uncharacterized protein n=1 Tax=Frondihabitans sucicola TaxID=1268041 RepID=A0ABN6Y982_9MICO|nr:hypothetical protein [Frondihabitans sucicola]BDZ52546.1 hypothetical protein GCM10025867_47870 [Frondihabitans sucicola]
MSDDKPDRPAFGSMTRKPNGPRPAPDASSDPIDRAPAPVRAALPSPAVQQEAVGTPTFAPTPASSVSSTTVGPAAATTPIVVTKRGRGPARPFTTTIGDDVRALMEVVKRDQGMDLREIIETAVVEKYGYLRR